MTHDRAAYEQLFAFIHALARRVGAGTPLPEALASLHAKIGDEEWREGVAFLRERVDQGETLSGAMLQRQELFPFLLGVMVRVGEVVGNLDDSLTRYTEYLRQEVRLLGSHRSDDLGATRDLALWCYRIGMLLQSGVPFLEALEASVEQPPISDALREAVLIIRATAREGGRPAVTMADFPDLFPDTVRQWFATGEETGTLDETALGLAETLETLALLGEPEPELTRRHGGHTEGHEERPEGGEGDLSRSSSHSGGSGSAGLPLSRPLWPSVCLSPCLRVRSEPDVAREILEEAIRAGASDVHLQPAAGRLRVRFRVDGALRTVRTIDGPGQTALLGALERAARLVVADRRLPHRGVMLFHSTETGQEHPIRLMTYPFADGEGITLRLHPQAALLAGLTDLGMTPEQAEQSRRLLRQPSGLLVVAGGSGSGRTTTLYTLLRELHREGSLARRSVVTLESPVEIPWDEINQVPLDASLGLTLSEATRGALQQDPDILMAGDVRDAVGLAAVVDAAVSGCLVLMGMTAAGAAHAVEQLLEWEPQRAAGQLLAVIAPRLARRRCGECGGSGCEACRQTGYRGRTGLFEVFATDTPTMRRLLHAHATSDELYGCAAREGMLSLEQAAAHQVAEGMTTAEEARRVLSDRPGPSVAL